MKNKAALTQVLGLFKNSKISVSFPLLGAPKALFIFHVTFALFGLLKFFHFLFCFFSWLGVFPTENDYSSCNWNDSSTHDINQSNRANRAMTSLSQNLPGKWNFYPNFKCQGSESLLSNEIRKFFQQKILLIQLPLTCLIFCFFFDVGHAGAAPKTTNLKLVIFTQNYRIWSFRKNTKIKK